LLSRENVQHSYFFTDVEELDITDSEAVEAFVEFNAIDCIVNCAAYTAVDKAEEKEELCDLLNNVAPGHLAKAVGKRGGIMVQVSTDYVFDGTNHIPYTESEPTCPNSVYGRTKLAGEQSVMANCTNAMIIRTAWLYSEYGKNFCKTMLKLTAERPTLQVVYDQCGTPTYALDLAKAICAILKDYNTTLTPLTETHRSACTESNYPKSGIYHYSNLGVCSWFDFTKMIQDIANQLSDKTDVKRNCKIVPCLSRQYPSPVKRPAYSVLDKTKIQTTFGVEIPYWTDSLRQCIANLLTIH
jgi:dTDP-4-dehydrorhamnose reductase